MEIKTLNTVNTEYSADSVEWCPNEKFANLFVCGTYHLEESNGEVLKMPTRRKGCITLYEWNFDDDSLVKLEVKETAAILDQKWYTVNNKILLAAANAIGEVQLYELLNDDVDDGGDAAAAAAAAGGIDENEKLKLISSVLLPSTELNDTLLTLAIDWTKENNVDRLLASDSQGGISLLQLRESTLDILLTWKAHSFEAWTCCFNKYNSNIIYTGGDDSYLHIFDTRAFEQQQNESKECQKPKSTIKSHFAGITSLLHIDEHLLLTGSYDEKLRLFDLRQMKNPMSELNLNGGIWRLKSNPLQSNIILCACMYRNFSIVKLNKTQCESGSSTPPAAPSTAIDNHHMELIGEYDEHNSICYGCDWYSQTLNNSNDMLLMATCSFYDQQLCISNVKY